MNLTEFEKSLKNGTGNAITFLMNNKASDEHIEAIFNISTKCYVYDKQCEGGRGHYLWNAINFSGARDILQRRILEIMNDREEYDLEQCFELAGIFYSKGNKSALEFMHKNLRYSEGWSSYIGSDEIITAEGSKGIQFVFKNIAERFLFDENFDGDYFLCLELKEKYGLDKLLDILSPFMLGNPRFKDYLINDHKFESTGRLKYEVSYDVVKDNLNKYNKHFMFVWGKEASDKDILKAAYDLLVATEENVVLRLLSVFRRRKFPLKYTPILKWLDSDNDEVVSSAIELLKEFQSQDIYRIAMSNIQVKENWYEYLPLLTYNYNDKDSELIYRQICSVSDEDIMHSIIMNFGYIIDNCNVNNFKLLNHMYLDGRCSLCRTKIVEVMIKNFSLNEDKLLEFKYDSNEIIRRMVEDGCRADADSFA
ncbi:hypothetical protein [Vallitalea okinawensis]|uniref:hypothetical protein n=1 Tax=Vallitalea okinawensis TaxID=2078660 RepID=UPI000CFB2A41|nr:hypothetical protein [Vallitalea okinawensis]